MAKKIVRMAVPSLAAIGLVFSAGQVDAEKPDAGMKAQLSVQAQQEVKVVQRLDKVEKKPDSVQAELEEVEAALSKAEALTEEELDEYARELESFFHRLNAAENHLDAITKKLGDDNSAVEETEQLIEGVRTNVIDAQEELDSVSSEVPAGLEMAENPTFEVGSEAIIEADHMEGMQGAEATVVGAYDTTAYAVSYTPTDGGERVTNHKWVIHEEIEETGEEHLEPGTDVTLDADHMEGMDGATAEIDSAVETTVYMIDFVPTTGGEEVNNHKWLIESELSSK